MQQTLITITIIDISKFENSLPKETIKNMKYKNFPLENYKYMGNFKKLKLPHTKVKKNTLGQIVKNTLRNKVILRANQYLP